LPRLLKTFLLVATGFGLCTVIVSVYNSSRPKFQLRLLDSKPRIQLQKWALNFNILQHSSFIITSEPLARVETLFAFVSFETEGGLAESEVSGRLQCVLRNRLTNQSELFNSTKILKLFTRPLKTTVLKVPWKVVCDIGHWRRPDSPWEVAILDRIDMTSKMNELSLSRENMFRLLQYQELKAIDASRPKLKEVGHCLHAIRDLDSAKVQKLLKWLLLQKKIGYKKVKIYFYDDARKYANLIYEKYDADFVEIVQHESNFSVVCNWHIENYLNNPHDELARYLFSYCKQVFDKLFNFGIDDINFVHGRSQTNDCYLQFKYIYEFTTNYDFDEILLPRKINPFINSIPDEYQNCKLDTYSYSIYNYSVELFEKYGGRGNVSSIEFDCLIYVPDDEFFKLLVQQIGSFSKKSTNSTYFSLVKDNQPESARIYYLMNTTFTDNIDYFFKTKKTYDCLKQYSSDQVVTDFFNAILTSHKLHNWYHGKSIFNTDLTEYTTFHYGAPGPKPGVRIVQLPFESGFVSHFRDNIEKYYKNQPIPFRHLTFDIEYFKFFLNSTL
jgi:hypothetical protein